MDLMGRGCTALASELDDALGGSERWRRLEQSALLLRGAERALQAPRRTRFKAPCAHPRRRDDHAPLDFQRRGQAAVELLTGHQLVEANRRGRTAPQQMASLKPEETVGARDHGDRVTLFLALLVARALTLAESDSPSRAHLSELFVPVPVVVAMRRCKSRYSPELKTISETATMAVSTKQASPLDDAEPVARKARTHRSLSTPPTRRREPSSTRTKSARAAEQRENARRDAHKAAGSSVSPTETPTPTSKNKYERTALHNAVRKGDKREVKRLALEHPELLRRADSRGNLPLHYAASPSVPDGATIVYMLLKAGTPVNALNERRQTALVLNVISCEDDSDLVPRILLYHNAKPAIKVTEDLMLAPYAAARGLHKVAAAIREYM